MASTRRMVLIGGASAAGALVVGYALWPSGRIAAMDALDARAGEKFITNWLKIAQDDTITVIIPHCDMGTGIFTSLTQMAAEELDADWSKMRAEQAPSDKLFANGVLIEDFALNGAQPPAFLRGITERGFRLLAANVDLPGAGYVPQITGGSSAVRATGALGIRVSAAAAREMLIKAAAARWDASAGDCITKNNCVIHKTSGKRLRYGELVTDAAEYTPSSNPQLKAKRAYTLVGQSVPRFDIPNKVNGKTQYGIDTRLPGMLYAAIRISPVFGGKLKAVSVGAVSKMRGVQKIVQLEDAVVVVADRFWRANNAASSLNPTFDNGANGAVTSASISARRAAALNGGDLKSDLKTGDGAAALSKGRLIEATYEVPYLSHAPMEPVNTTALFKDGKLEVWAGTQDGLGSRGFCADAAGLSMDDVTFHLLQSGGAFGRRLPGQYNFLTYAVKTAMAMEGTPVKLIFTREQDMQHDFYRPNVMSRFRATLDSRGMPLAWVNDYTTDDDANPEAHPLYNVASQEIRAANVPTHVPVGAWRSVESSWHGFFIESFIDELAHAAKADPLAYRLALLGDKPRHRAVLKTAAKAAGWNTPLPQGRARGIAMVECFQTIVAHVAEITVAPDGSVKVDRIVTAADCGMAVNPDGFKAQIEGGIIFGLSAALSGEITIDKGAVTQANFPEYPVVKLADCPQIDVHLVQSDAPLGGAGEPGVPPVAPAIANAIFAATGVRIRKLPVRNHALTAKAQQAGL